MTPAILGALRSLLAVVIMAVVTWLANAANLQGIVAPAIGTIVSIERGDATLYQTAVLRPAVDLGTLDRVVVVPQ